MLLQVLVPCLALVRLCAAGYVTVPLQSPAGVTYVNAQQHVGLLAGPVRYTSGAVVQDRSNVVSVTPGPAPTYYSYNIQPQVFGKPNYSPAVQYHTTYGGPTVRVFPDVKSYPVYPGGTHTVQTVPVSVSTTQYHHTQDQVPVHVPAPTPVPVHVPVPTPVPVHVPVPTPLPVHVPVPVPVTPTYTKTVTTGPSYIAPERHVPVVRSRKFKVRRPAIQNQFYDIEERVIIRPVGSALVELEQPVSQSETTQTKTTKTTTTTVLEKRPTVDRPVPEPDYGTRTVERPHVVTQTTTVYTERPPAKGGYGRIAAESAAASGTGRTSDAEVIDTAALAGPSERPFYTQGHAVFHGHHATGFVQPYATHLAPHPFVYHPGNAGHLLHHVAYVNHPSTVAPHPTTLFRVPSSTPLYPVTPAVAVPVPAADCDRDTKTSEYLPPSPTTPQTPTLATTTPKPFPAQQDDEEEYDDSVVVDARSGAGNFSDYAADTDYADSTEVPVTSAATTTAGPLVYHHDKYRGTETSKQAIEVSYATRTTPASDMVAFDPSTATFDLGPTIIPTTTAPPTPVHRPTVSPAITLPQRSVTIISSTTPRTVSARFSDQEAVTTGVASQSVVVGQGLTQEQIHANQQQFIKLLSERDSIAEVGFGPKTDSSGTLIDAYVRSRVLSATPAPRDAKETSRTVNIRRIVVSRPVETEQEVEVREQGYATTIAPPSYEHKRDVADAERGQSADQQPPVYVTAKPPAFANDQPQ